jgi:hypothetical protein
MRGSSIGVVGQNLQAKQQPGASFTKVIIYGPNPLLLGTKDLGIKYNDGELIISLLSLQCGQTGLWNFSAPSNCSYKKMPELKEFAYGRTIEGVLGAFGIQPAQAPAIEAYVGPNVNPRALSNDQTVLGKIKLVGDPFKADMAIKAYNVGVEILKGNAKPDEKKCEEWEQQRLALLGFLIKQLGDIKHSLTIGEKDESSKDGKSIINQVLETFGVYKDLATVSKNLRTGGLGLLVDAAEVISKNLDKKKERKEKKSDSLISHPKFEEFASYFCSDLSKANEEFREV